MDARQMRNMDGLSVFSIKLDNKNINIRAIEIIYKDQ